MKTTRFTIRLSEIEVAELEDDIALMADGRHPPTRGAFLVAVWRAWRAGRRYKFDGVRSSTAKLGVALHVAEVAIADAQGALSSVEAAAGLVLSSGARIDEPVRKRNHPARGRSAGGK